MTDRLVHDPAEDDQPGASGREYAHRSPGADHAALRGVVLALLVGLLAGCGGGSVEPSAKTDGPGSNGTGGGAAFDDNKPKEIRADKLLKLEGSLPPLPVEGGKAGYVKVQPPVGWETGTRSPDHIVWFHDKSVDTELPRIRLRLDERFDAAKFPFDTVTRDNLPQFAAEARKQIEERLGKNEKLVEPVRAMMIGDRPCVRYVRKLKLGQLIVVRQIVTTLVKGKFFRVELLVYKSEEIPSNNKATYAVVAGFEYDPDAKPVTPAAGLPKLGG